MQRRQGGGHPVDDGASATAGTGYGIVKNRHREDSTPFGHGLATPRSSSEGSIVGFQMTRRERRGQGCTTEAPLSVVGGDEKAFQMLGLWALPASPSALAPDAVCSEGDCGGSATQRSSIAARVNWYVSRSRSSGWGRQLSSRLFAQCGLPLVSSSGLFGPKTDDAPANLREEMEATASQGRAPAPALAQRKLCSGIKSVVSPGAPAGLAAARDRGDIRPNLIPPMGMSQRMHGRNSCKLSMRGGSYPGRGLGIALSGLDWMLGRFGGALSGPATPSPPSPRLDSWSLKPRS